MTTPDKTKLICLPYAGAGASFYRPWTALAGDALEIVALQLPGRERLIDEEPYRDVQGAVDGLLAQLRDRLEDSGDGGGRLAVFGHSLGAVLAYELAHRLVDEPGAELVHLFVSGSPEPARGRERQATGLSDEDFLARVGEFAGYHHPALDNPGMQEMILPALRADVEMHENYVPGTDLPLNVPLTVVRGEDDDLVGYDDAESWSKVAGRDFEHVEVPGGHMYLTDTAATLVRLIVSTVL
jgi:surfactin synthase thioesterase subunit